jgi:hypothetical protein
MTAEYRTIEAFPGYRFGDDGSIQSCLTKRGALGSEWRNRKLLIKSNGYAYVTLWLSKQHCRRYVHRLILEAFVGPCPEGMHGCHSDGCRSNNKLTNLRWDTPSANEADKAVHGTRIHGAAQHSAKLTDDIVVEARDLYASGSWTLESLARKFNVSIATIHSAIRGKHWKHVVR